ncbi:MAG: FAD-dependent oxidoreductase [Pseudomonadota bacterium]
MKADIAVLGRGLWGTAAAMYLARSGARIALVGPGEGRAQGPRASHHDAGRITRSIATNVVWARAAARSIARYPMLEAESGVAFYTACGGMMASEDAGYIHAIRDTAAAVGIAYDQVSGPDLASAASMFQFSDGTKAILDSTGGVIDPRAMRRAHEVLAIRAGADIVDDVVTDLAGGEVTLVSGATLSAGQILVATGAYAALSPWMPERPKMRVAARTVYFAEVDATEAARLAAMPSLIWRPDGLDHYLYLLPPIRYPDGRLLVKIGGEDDGPVVQTEGEALDWFTGHGNSEVAETLKSALTGLMPGLAIKAEHSAPCILALTDIDRPCIERRSDRLTIATACNGAGAKGADELGRLAAQITLGHGDAATELGDDLRTFVAAE